MSPQYEWDAGRQDGIHGVFLSYPSSRDEKVLSQDVQSGGIPLSSKDDLLKLRPHILAVSAACDGGPLGPCRDML